MTAASANLDAQFASASILNVADAVQHVLLPELSGNARLRAGECVTILERMAQLLAAESSGKPAALDSMDAKAAMEMVNSEGQAIDSGERIYHDLEEAIRSPKIHSDRSFDPARLEKYLQQHALGGSGLRVTDSKPLAGGRSKQTILVEQEGGIALPTQLVIRQDWATAVTGTSVVSEFKLLQRIWQAGLKVPQPLLIEASSEALGAPFLVVTRLQGGPKGDMFNPLPSERLAFQVAEQLGALHSLPAGDFENLGVPTQAYTPDQLQAELSGFAALHARFGVGFQSIDIAIRWLGIHLHRLDGPRVMVHNDLGCHNFLIEGEELIAILDWEVAHLGNPAADLGYIRGWIEKMTTWERFLERYYAAGGFHVSDLTRNFYSIWCSIRLYSLLIQARAGVSARAVRDTEITYAVAQFLPQLLQRISKDLRRILAMEAVAP